MKYFVENWRKITSDKNILDIVQNCHIEFDCDINKFKILNRKMHTFSKEQEMIIQKEICKLLEMKVIIEVDHVDDEIISPIFTVPKKDSEEHRMILNLKELNKLVTYYHFKMDTFETALKLIKKNNFMASVDLRHAYYSVPIAIEHQKYLRFMWKNKVFQYTCLPNGVSCAPRIFTKLLKPVYSTLRKSGHKNSGYIDDSLLAGDTYDECSKNITDTVDLMENLGLVIHEKKSVLIPTKTLIFLGNCINSENMTVTLPTEKVHHIVLECKTLYKRKTVSIRQIARVLGLMVSSLSAVEYGALFYRNIERQKIDSLKTHCGNFEAIIQMTDEMRKDLLWWIQNLHIQKRHILHENPSLVIITDASMKGWAAVCEDCKIGGRWNVFETDNHINYLEMLAIFYGIKSFCKSMSNTHIQIKSDNSCAISYINEKGGTKSLKCNDLSKEIWMWCIDRNIWISVTFVPGKNNVADEGSRKFNENVEWMLDTSIFDELSNLWNIPKLDLFASRLNKQIDRYVSWYPDPGAENINAFSLDWSKEYMYIFCPFSLIMRCVQKIHQDRAECLMICPMWTTQSWWPVLMEMVIDYPRILPRREKLLTIPGTRKVHPLQEKLTLIACRLSGDPYRTKMFIQNLSILSCVHGEVVPKNNMLATLKSGQYSVIKGKLLPFKYL